MSVSVLIPAFRPRFLGQSIASVLAQSFSDFELLISDDSGGEEVAEVVSRYRDPRISYSRTAGREGAKSNMSRLWSQAARPRLKYLFDDDVLHPSALTDLCELLDRTPGVGLAFGHRDIIDAEGRVISEPRLIAPGKAVALAADRLAPLLLPACDNRIGEFSNVLINRSAGVELAHILDYRGLPMEMLNDVSFYLNAARVGPLAGVGRTVAQFRRHGDQHSSPAANPLYTKVVAEWEVVIRGEISAGTLKSEAAMKAIDTLDRFYGLFVDRLPELVRLQRELPELRRRVSAGDRMLLDEAFLTQWHAVEDDRRARVSANG